MGRSIEPRRRTGRRRVLASTALTAVLPDLDKVVALGSARIFEPRQLDHPAARPGHLAGAHRARAGARPRRASGGADGTRGMPRGVRRPRGGGATSGVGGPGDRDLLRDGRRPLPRRERGARLPRRLPPTDSRPGADPELLAAQRREAGAAHARRPLDQDMGAPRNTRAYVGAAANPRRRARRLGPMPGQSRGMRWPGCAPTYQQRLPSGVDAVRVRGLTGSDCRRNGRRTDAPLALAPRSSMPGTNACLHSRSAKRTSSGSRARDGHRRVSWSSHGRCLSADSAAPACQKVRLQTASLLVCPSWHGRWDWPARRLHRAPAGPISPA